MKLITLDDKKIELDTSLNFEERLEVFNDIYEQYRQDIEDCWETFKTKVFLDVLYNYLYPVESTNRNEKLLLTKRKHKEMDRGSHKYSNFSNLKVTEQRDLGLFDNEN